MGEGGVSKTIAHWQYAACTLIRAISNKVQHLHVSMMVKYYFRHDTNSPLSFLSHWLDFVLFIAGMDIFFPSLIYKMVR